MSAALKPALVIAPSLKVRLIVRADAVALVSNITKKATLPRVRSPRLSFENRQQKISRNFISPLPVFERITVLAAK